MQDDFNDEDRYYQLLDYIKKLLKRQNIVNNTYLFKKMNSLLTIPLYIIADEHVVSGITRNYDQIIDALQNSGLAHVVDNREVKIIEHANVKVNIKNEDALREIEKILEQKNKKYQVSKRLESKDYVNLTVFGENILWLEKIISNIGKEVIYQKTTLIQDITNGVNRIRKLKFQHAKSKTTVGKFRYSMNNPPPVFVRKVLQSSDDQTSEPLVRINDHKNGVNGHNNRNKKYVSNHKESLKPKLNDQDFPELA